MDSDWGLRYFWYEKEISVVNDSKRTLYVDIDEPHSVTGVKPGDEGRYPITRCSVRVTISYYSENKEMYKFLDRNSQFLSLKKFKYLFIFR